MVYYALFFFKEADPENISGFCFDKEEKTK